MAYSKYTVQEVKRQFGLVEKRYDLFGSPTPALEPSAWLLETLEIGKLVPKINEKSKAEFIVSPILLEVKRRNATRIGLYSGHVLDADKKAGLNGECDYILSKSPDSTTIDTPIFCMVEAENDNIYSGFGQCIAQMVGAQVYNAKENNNIEAIFGCVTTGTDWLFMKLEKQTIFVDIDNRYLANLNQIIGIFQHIIDSV